MKTLSKEFFSSKAGKAGIWVLIWIFEYLFFSWYINKFPQKYIIIPILIGYALILYCIYFWITQKHSTECMIYAFIILEFILHKWNQKNVFVNQFKCPFWIIYIIILAYFFIRIFIIEKFYHLLHDIYLGFVEASRDRMKQRVEESIDRQKILENERKKKSEYAKNKSLLRRQFWYNLKNVIIDFLSIKIDFFVSIPLGFFRKRIKSVEIPQNSEAIQTGQQPSKENELRKSGNKNNNLSTPKWIYVVSIPIIVIALLLFCLFLYYQYYILKNDTNFISNIDIFTSFLSNLQNNKSPIELTTKIIYLFILDFIVLIVLMIIAFVIFVIFIQIIKSADRMVKDLIKTINSPDTTDNSSIIFYSAIVFCICFFIYKMYPFETNTLAELLSNGSIIIYPVIVAVFIPIITTVIDFFKKDSITTFLKSPKVKNIKNQFSGLALGTLEAMLNYLTFVTKDFLQTIQELSIDEFKNTEEDIYESNEDNNDNNCNNNDNIDNKSNINNKSDKPDK